MNWTIFQVFVLIELSLSLAPSEIVILIMSQPDTYHIKLAENLRSDIYNQSLLINKDHLVNVHLLHETFNHPGDWTFLAVLPSFTAHNIIKPLTKWIILCEDRSTVNLENLIEELVKEDHSKDLYLGYPLHDREATIIHHFAFFENPQWFHYPLIRAGVAFTVPLIKRLTELVKVEKQATEFFIDASHELSLFIWQNMKIENNKVVQTQKDTIALPLNEVNPNIPKQQRTTTENSRLRVEQNRRKSIVDDGQNGSKLSREKEHKLLMVKAPYLCPSKGYGCAIYPNEATLTCDPISAETIFFAIKTCHKFHKDRIPTIEMTWGRYAVHKRFFSDFEDERIPTVSTGVPNTETGHCGKTLSILKLAIQEVEDMNLRLEKPIQWIFLSDDDTLLSVSAVSDILGCFNAEHTIYLGERYGYRLHSGDGFNYITGGGGIAFSLPAARKIVRSCTCPTISSPDDMILGSCLQRLGVRAIHSPRFHQARPPDYSPKLLALEKPVSFHKFWQIDPLQVYNQWFKSSDEALKLKSKINCDINTSRCTKIRRNLKNGKKYGDKVPIPNTRPPHVDL